MKSLSVAMLVFSLANLRLALAAEPDTAAFYREARTARAEAIDATEHVVRAIDRRERELTAVQVDAILVLGSFKDLGACDELVGLADMQAPSRAGKGVPQNDATGQAVAESPVVVALLRMDGNAIHAITESLHREGTTEESKRKLRVYAYVLWRLVGARSKDLLIAEKQASPVSLGKRFDQVISNVDNLMQAPAGTRR